MAHCRLGIEFKCFCSRQQQRSWRAACLVTVLTAALSSYLNTSRAAATEAPQAQYAAVAYWDKRYESSSEWFEWYSTYNTLRPVLDRYIQDGDAILHVGVGTSELQRDLLNHRPGFTGHIVNTDISPVAVDHMRELHRDLAHQLTYQVSDARMMPEFADGPFDVLIDKGTLDAIRCGATADIDSIMLLQEYYRVLQPHGSSMLISHGPPFARLPWLMQDGLHWSIEIYVLDMAGHDESLLEFNMLSPVVYGPVAPAQLAYIQPSPNISKQHYVYVCTKWPQQAT